MFLENHHMDAAAADIHHKCGVGDICLLNPFVQNQPWLVHSLKSVKGFISVVDSHILCVQNHSGWSVHFCNFSARRATVSPCCRSAVVSNSLIVVLLLASSSSLSSSYSFLSLSLTPWSLVSSRLKLSDCLIGEQLSGASLQLMRPPFHDDDDEEEEKK